MCIRLISLALFTIALGCSPDMRTFSVSARNDTKSYLTLNLAKNVPQYEPLWASPEDLDVNRVMLMPDTELGVITVPPGRQGVTKDVQGHFPDNAQAVLRIYRGEKLSMRELLAMQPGADRQDVVLKPGDNRFVVHDVDGRLTVDRVVRGAATPAPPNPFSRVSGPDDAIVP